MKRVAIVGGGIAGLSLAHALLSRGARSRGIELSVLERSARAGGNIRSEEVDGYLCEWGPNGFLDNVPETLALVRALGLEDRLQSSDDAARKRFVFRGGRLHALPGGPGEFLRSRLLTGPGKLRIALEPFARKRSGGDETIHAFASRRIGREAADVLIDSMVSGIFAGDARELSLRACFPRMWQLETDHGGLFRALFALRRQKRRQRGSAGSGAQDPIGAPGGRLTSFRSGTEELIRALAAALGSSLRTEATVERLEERPGRSVPPFRLTLRSGETLEADTVVLTGSARETARIVGEMDEELAAVLDEITTAPVGVVALGYEEAALSPPLHGFGFLVPRSEGPRVLGVLWDSSIFPGRAPPGRVLLRAMIGGARDPAAVEQGDEELLAEVRADLRATMGLEAKPVFTRIVRHRVGIPQYTVGHLDRLRKIEERLDAHPGLFLGGNSYSGVAMNACVAEAGRLAERVLAAEPR